MTVVLLTGTPFGPREHERLRLETLERRGVPIEVYDWSWSRNRLLSAIGATRDDETFFVCLLDYEWHTLPVFRRLAKHRQRYGLLLADTQPAGNTALRSHILHERAPLAARTTRRFAQIIPRELLGVRPPEVIIAGGTRALAAEEARIAGPETRVLWAHTFDVDRYLDVRRNQYDQRENIVVFLDQFLAEHVDQLQQGDFCDPRTYYVNLRRAFDAVETTLGTHVVVAAHPAARYAPYDQRFGGREVVRGKTAELVARSRLVLAHDSTAIGFAVLSRVPIVFITDDGITRNPVRRESARAMADMLELKVHNLDSDPLPAWEQEMIVDDAKYAAYQSALLKRPDTPELALWDIVLGYLRGEMATSRFVDVHS